MPEQRTSNWDEEAEEKVKLLWNEGYSASQIAQQMPGRTRSMVCGKLHRLGLLGSGLLDKPKMPVFRGHPAANVARALPKAPKPEPAPAELASWVGEDGQFATLETIADNQCHWPIGEPGDKDFHYCGHQGKPYCAAHARKGHQPLASKGRRYARS